MENAYQHLISLEGEEQARKLVHHLYCHLKLGEKVKLPDSMISDLVHGMVAPLTIIDELVYYTKLNYQLDEFLNEVPETEFEKILLDFEIWDKMNPEEIVYNIKRRTLYG